MRKSIKSIQRGATTLHKIARPGIQSFREQPNVERTERSDSNQAKLHASDLFSLFTADIIKEQKLFTR
jgi:hypothetical protein